MCVDDTIIFGTTVRIGHNVHSLLLLMITYLDPRVRKARYIKRALKKKAFLCANNIIAETTL